MTGPGTNTCACNAGYTGTGTLCVAIPPILAPPPDGGVAGADQ
jgi:hypothetical protein